jgi:multiple sugar transport system substrate-binding protein
MARNKISRREFLRTAAGAGAGLVVAGSGIALAQDATATPAPTPTPAPLPVGSAGTLTVIQKTEYFPDAQQLIHDDITKFAADKGIQLDLSTANPEVFGDFLAKMVAAVQAGNPPDVSYHTISVPQMYSQDILEDVSDVVEDLISKYGTTVPQQAEFNAKIDGKWWSVPFSCNAAGWFARKDVFDAAGIDVSTLDTWDKRRDACLAVSNPDKKMWGWGLTVNKSGDGHGLISGIIQSYGGSFTDETGLKVTFNSPETVAAVQWLADTYMLDKYKPMLPPGVESWTDTSNNEAYLAGTIALTTNQPSVYAAAKANNPDVFANTAVLHGPKTPNGPLLEGGNIFWFSIFKGAKNVDAAKDLIRYMIDPAQFNAVVKQGGGLNLPAYKNLWTDDIVAADPNFGVFRDILFNPVLYYGLSHPAKPSALIDSINAAAITSQMMANIISGGMSVADAVKDANDKIVALWEEAGVPQS